MERQLKSYVARKIDLLHWPYSYSAKEGTYMKKSHIAILVLSVVLVVLLSLGAQDPAYTEDEKQPEETTEADAVTMATAPTPDYPHDMEAAIDFIEKNVMGYLATVDNGKPRVRAFAVLKIEGDTLYFSTANTKAVFQQLKQTPYAEWVAMDPATWTTLRVLGEVVFVDDIGKKREAIASNPMIKNMYSGEKEKEFELFYLRDVELNWFGMSQAPEETKEDWQD
jgi:uncharacterized pyridoxamine 5'-phosphate oxidase family protein